MTGGGGDDGGGGGDVEGLGGAARAAGVEHGPVEAPREFDGRDVVAHDAACADEFLDGGASCGDECEEGADLRIEEPAFEKLGEDGGGVGLVEGSPGEEE